MTTNDKDVIFDIPSIISLKKDEIITKLGQPTEISPEPEDAQERGGTWRMVYEKDGKKLLVLYQLESKEVHLAYIEGNDKDELVKISGAKKDAPNYAYDFFMDIQDTNKVLGIRFEKKVPTKINASVVMSDKGFLLTNNEGVRYYGCEFLLNDNYWFSAPEGIEVGKPKLLKYVDFRLLTQRDKEFDILTMKPKKFDLKCDMIIQKKRALTINF